MEEKKQGNLMKSFIDYFYGNFVVLLLGFISLPLVTRVLDTDEYGRTALFTSAVSVIYIFAILGLDQAYIRYFYKAGTSRRKLFLQCLIPPSVIVLFLSALYFAGADTFNRILFERSGMDITLLVISYTVLSVFERFLFLNIRMEQRGRLYSNLNILSKVLNISLIILFAVRLGNDFRVVLYAMTISFGIVTLLVGIRYVCKVRSKDYHEEMPDGSNGEAANAAEVTQVSERELLKYGIPFIMMLMMEWLLSSMDKWSIRIFCDYAETGIYSAAMQIMTVLLTFKITFVAFWSPVAMEKYEKETEEINKPFFADIFRKVQFLCMAAAFGLTICRGLIVLILGKGYRDAISIIPFLTLMPILSILFEVVSQGIKFKKQVKYINYASLIAIICNLAGNTLLVPVIGGKGAAMATAATYVVYFFIGTYFAEKCYPVGYPIKTLAISLILYIVYAAYATFCSTEWISISIGILFLFIVCGLNHTVIKDLFIFVKSIRRS